MAHAEASARTVEAAVTAAAAQLGLRSDQVDVEVLEEPVPSTFGYIGSPARVRVTPRQPASPTTPSGDARDAAHGSPPNGPGATTPSPDTTRVAGAGQPSDVGGVVAPADPDLAQASPPLAAGSGWGSGSAAPAGSGGASGSTEPTGVGQAPSPAETGGSGQASDAADPAGSGKVSDPVQAPGPGQTDLAQATSPRASGLAEPSAPARAPAAAQAADLTHASARPEAAGTPGAESTTPDAMASSQAYTSNSPNTPEFSTDSTSSSALAPDRSAPDRVRESTSSAPSLAEPHAPLDSAATQAPLPTEPSSQAADVDASGHTIGVIVPGDSDPSRSEAGRASVDQAPMSASSSSSTTASGDRESEPEGSAAISTAATASAIEKTPPESSMSEPSNATRPRRAHRDEPIDPEMVEADTERAGDFLEGLLDALDVDGDITTWIDEAGGHIELEGSDLNVLVGPNGETLDALQELTRIAVLRQSKRRVRLLLDINGFRSRQRDELISVVKATAERVIRSREDHEFEPMTPAERKIVHDAVAAIEGVRTESLGEEPYRRVIIRPE